jgi:hypothetical protein
MKKLNCSFEKLEDKLFNAYDILSDAGFELLVEDGSLLVYLKGCNIEIDCEEGIVIIPEDKLEEFWERQEMLY